MRRYPYEDTYNYPAEGTRGCVGRLLLLVAFLWMLVLGALWQWWRIETGAWDMVPVVLFVVGWFTAFKSENL